MKGAFFEEMAGNNAYLPVLVKFNVLHIAYNSCSRTAYTSNLTMLVASTVGYMSCKAHWVLTIQSTIIASTWRGHFSKKLLKFARLGKFNEPHIGYTACCFNDNTSNVLLKVVHAYEYMSCKSHLNITDHLHVMTNIWTGHSSNAVYFKYCRNVTFHVPAVAPVLITIIPSTLLCL